MKIGDKVRVIKMGLVSPEDSKFWLGKVGTIIDIDEEGPYEYNVKFENTGCHFKQGELIYVPYRKYFKE